MNDVRESIRKANASVIAMQFHIDNIVTKQKRLKLLRRLLTTSLAFVVIVFVSEAIL